VRSRLELEFEKLYLRLILPLARHSTRGAAKRYAGLLHAGDGPHVAKPVVARPIVEFVGMEVVRSDWTALAKQVQRELYERLFTDQPVEVYLAEIVRTLRAGTLDELLVYRKNLRKDADSYTATTPPHVAAARKSARAPGESLKKSVSYVMTTAGAEPLDNIQHPIDREHYVTRQIRPVAEPVLATLGLDFDTVIPGHGPVSTKADVAAFRADIDTMRTRLAGMVRQGKTKDDMVNTLEADYGWRAKGCPPSPPTPGCLQFQQADAMYAELKRGPQ